MAWSQQLTWILSGSQSAHLYSEVAKGLSRLVVSPWQCLNTQYLRSQVSAVVVGRLHGGPGARLLGSSA